MNLPRFEFKDLNFFGVWNLLFGILPYGKYGKGVNVSGTTGSDVSVPDFGY